MYTRVCLGLSTPLYRCGPIPPCSDNPFVNWYSDTVALEQLYDACNRHYTFQTCLNVLKFASRTLHIIELNPLNCMYLNA